MSIIIIASLIAVAFVWLLFYLVKKDSGKKEIEALYAKIEEINLHSREIGKIEPGIVETASITSNSYVQLKRLNRVFKSLTPEKFWLEIILENTSTSQLNFRIDSIQLKIAGKILECDPIILVENVPEYVSPNGKHYFNTCHYNNFILGKSGARTFCFLAGFDNTTYSNLNESDRVNLQIILINSMGETIKEHHPIKFSESFKNMRFKVIQAIDEQINWVG